MPELVQHVKGAHHSKGWAAKLQGLPSRKVRDKGSQLPDVISRKVDGQPLPFEWQGFLCFIVEEKMRMAIKIKRRWLLGLLIFKALEVAFLLFIVPRVWAANGTDREIDPATIQTIQHEINHEQDPEPRQAMQEELQKRADIDNRFELRNSPPPSGELLTGSSGTLTCPGGTPFERVGQSYGAYRLVRRETRAASCRT